MRQPVIIVHGGAGTIPDEQVEAFQRGCRLAAERGLALLLAGAPAEDAVEAAIRLLEDDGTFDAGRGSFLSQDGIVEMDAGFMEGAKLKAGAVAGVRDIANPITLARLVMASPHVFLIGEGASRFALQHGLRRCSPAELISPRELAAWRAWQEAQTPAPPSKPQDTVGAVALDAQGHLAAGTSTGGMRFKVPGRVGDVPCVGAGFYADDLLGAASCSGVGEDILRLVLAKRAVDALADGRAPQQAAEEAIAYLARRIAGRAGLILLDRHGRVGCAFNTPRMARAWSEGERIICRINP
jgi:beta-aspartyl-peptidase (threonine type)